MPPQEAPKRLKPTISLPAGLSAVNKEVWQPGDRKVPSSALTKLTKEGLKSRSKATPNRLETDATFKVKEKLESGSTSNVAGVKLTVWAKTG